MKRAFLSFLLMGLWACGGTDSSIPSGGQGKTGNGNNNGGGSSGSSNTGDQGAKDSGAPTPPPPPPPPPPDAGPACPNLEGAWTGKVQGTVSGQQSGTVTGTANLIFAPGAAKGDYDLQKGSQLVLNVDVGITQVPITQDVAGTAKCGVLDAAQDYEVMGFKVHGTAKCTFTETGCSGTWSAAPDDNTSKGSGTFTVAKK
jgi:hypothetical protein